MELWQIASRILFFAVNPHLEMQMVTGRAPGRTHLSDDIPSLYLLPLSYQQFGAVRLECDETAAVVDHHMAPLAGGGVAHQVDSSSEGGPDRCPLGHSQIDAGVSGTLPGKWVFAPAKF